MDMAIEMEYTICKSKDGHPHGPPVSGVFEFTRKIDVASKTFLRIQLLRAAHKRLELIMPSEMAAFWDQASEKYLNLAIVINEGQPYAQREVRDLEGLDGYALLREFMKMEERGFRDSFKVRLLVSVEVP